MNFTPQAESVRLEIENSIARVTINRPHRLNAFSGSMRDQLARAITTSSAREDVRVIVITGEGRAFSAGADLVTMSALIDAGDAAGFSQLVDAGTRVVRAIRSARQPVIAAVNGAAVGAGASLAIACDLRIASASAYIGFTFNRIGLHPDWGATFFLPRLVGMGRASELILSARIVDAPEAHTLGIFERVAPASDFDGEVEALSAELAAKAPRALEHAKRSLAADEIPALEDAMRREAEAQLICFGSTDVAEGVRAFQEKRQAIFSGS